MNAQNGKLPSNTTRRWRWLAGALGGFLLIALVYGTYWAQVLRYHQTTDDAYVGGNVVQITSQISGTVIGLGADDTQFVKTGQALVRLDQADARVALDQAEAQLARTVRDVRNLFATSAQLEAAAQQRETDLAAAQSDLARRQRLGTSGAVSGEELQHAIDAVKAAQAGLLAAQQQLAANRARVDGTTLKDHPQVRDAAAAVRNAYLTLARTELPAPVAGFVARRNVQLGQRVSPGTPLMAVVPLDQVWVDANFKEPQLHRTRCARGGRAPAADRAFHEGRRGREPRWRRGAPSATRQYLGGLVDGCIRLEQCAGGCTRAGHHCRQPVRARARAGRARHARSLPARERAAHGRGAASAALRRCA